MDQVNIMIVCQLKKRKEQVRFKVYNILFKCIERRLKVKIRKDNKGVSSTLSRKKDSLYRIKICLRVMCLLIHFFCHPKRIHISLIPNYYHPKNITQFHMIGHFRTKLLIRNLSRKDFLFFLKLKSNQVLINETR